MDEQKERELNEILNLPYSELTDSEIERVIKFKADVQTRDALYSETCRQQKEALKTIAEIHAQAAETCLITLENLTQNALIYNEDSKNEPEQ